MNKMCKKSPIPTRNYYSKYIMHRSHLLQKNSSTPGTKTYLTNSHWCDTSISVCFLAAKIKKKWQCFGSRSATLLTPPQKILCMPKLKYFFQVRERRLRCRGCYTEGETYAARQKVKRVSNILWEDASRLKFSPNYWSIFIQNSTRIRITVEEAFWRDMNPDPYNNLCGSETMIIYR